MVHVSMIHPTGVIFSETLPNFFFCTGVMSTRPRPKTSLFAVACRLAISLRESCVAKLDSKSLPTVIVTLAQLELSKSEPQTVLNNQRRPFRVKSLYFSLGHKGG